VTGGGDNPTFLAVNLDGRTLYATSEVSCWNEGTVTVYAIDAASGTSEHLNKQPMRGRIAAQASFDRTGRYLLVVNNGVGQVTQKPTVRWSYSRLARTVRSAPRSPRQRITEAAPIRAWQEIARAHCVLATPYNRHLVINDLGLDRLVITVSIALLPNKIGSRCCPPAGPGISTFNLGCRRFMSPTN
jgi:6-phosphogluconolactonase